MTARRLDLALHRQLLLRPGTHSAHQVAHRIKASSNELLSGDAAAAPGVTGAHHRGRLVGERLLHLLIEIGVVDGRGAVRASELDRNVDCALAVAGGKLLGGAARGRGADRCLLSSTALARISLFI